MAYTIRKRIKGHSYIYRLESFREKGKVKHHYLEYLGPEGKANHKESMVTKLYRENIGPVGQIMAEELAKAERRWPAEWIMAAMREAVINNQLRWSYIDRIIERYEREGFAPLHQEMVRMLEADVKFLPSSEQGNHRAKAPPVAPPIVASSSKTFATGITGLTRYEFEFKIADATKLIASNNPFTFAPNPKYPKELQPRLRERVATRLQVENIAANLEPDALLTDYKSIDRGAPIVGSDGVVESGNGRVMAIILAAKQHPEVYAKYKEALKAVAPSYALSVELVDKFKVPMLVRERLTKVDRKQFVEESNISTTIESSPIEKARTDAAKLTLDMLTSLELLEGEAIEDALRSLRNKPFVSAFLSKLPANEQARLVDAHGVLNQDGVRRVAMAIFVATFRGDVGLRLAERFFESADVNVRNCFNGITRSLGALARAESITASGDHQRDYSIGADLAKAITVFSAIKKTPGMTVAKYLAQAQILERELTPFQERVLAVLDERCRSAKHIGSILSSYAQLVIDSPPLSQVSFVPEAKATKEQLFETAVKRATDHNEIPRLPVLVRVHARR